MGKNKKVLIVDDDMIDNADNLGFYLGRKGIDLVVAEDYLGARAKYRADKYDLVLIDVMITGHKNGVELLKEIRETDKTTPIYVVSAYVNFEPAAMAAGADRFIRKPFSYKEHILKPLGLLKKEGS